jgi:Tat protein secretion system quality control protein TatD with DNase activity
MPLFDQLQTKFPNIKKTDYIPYMKDYMDTDTMCRSRNEPACLVQVVEMIALLKQVSIEEVVTQTMTNA